MNSVFSTIDNEIRKGAKTIVAVGDNDIFNQVINAMAKIMSQNINAKNVPLGFIPIGKKNNDIACYLGLGLNEDACDVISARRIKSFDLGVANDHYFLTTAKITTKGTTVEIDKNYSIEISEIGDVEVINMPVKSSLPEEIFSNPNDGVLELYINTTNSNRFFSLSGNKQSPSVFSFKKLIISNKQHKLTIDGSQQIKTPAEISIANEKINLIIGKNRKF
ncbi:MAG: diacylglycerol kinase family protein [Candidatus Gastranaerophilaceae bacterium]